MKHSTLVIAVANVLLAAVLALAAVSPKPLYAQSGPRMPFHCCKKDTEDRKFCCAYCCFNEQKCSVNEQCQKNET